MRPQIKLLVLLFVECPELAKHGIQRDFCGEAVAGIRRDVGINQTRIELVTAHLLFMVQTAVTSTVDHWRPP